MTTANEPAAPEEVERDIGQTRTRLAITVDAIERRLNAHDLVEKGLDMFKDNFNGNEVLNRTMDAVRANPVPFALMGIGAAWLIASGTGISDRIAESESVGAARRRVGEMANDLGNRASEIASDMAGRVGIGSSDSSSDGVLGHTGNSAIDEAGGGRGGGWVHQASGAAQSALRSVRDSGGAMMNRAGIYAGDGAGRVADRFTDTLERHPLVVGVVGLLAGTLIASVVPLSETERDWIGSTREDVWRKAEEAGEQAVKRVREAAASSATRVVDAAAEAATEAVREEVSRRIQG